MITFSDSFLRIWAVLAMVVLSILVVYNVLPGHVQSFIAEELTSLKDSPLGYMAASLVFVPAAVILGGFYLLMLLECGLAKELRHQSAWLIFMILVPLVSALAYFYHTRSSEQTPT